MQLKIGNFCSANLTASCMLPILERRVIVRKLYVIDIDVSKANSMKFPMLDIYHRSLKKLSFIRDEYIRYMRLKSSKHHETLIN